MFKVLSSNYPESLDWRNQNIVTPVKDQVCITSYSVEMTFSAVIIIICGVLLKVTEAIALPDSEYVITV